MTERIVESYRQAPSLQVRNRLVRHWHVSPGDKLDMRTRVGEQRVVDKGIEVDPVTRVMRGSTCCWEGRTTFFHRGRFGKPAPDGEPVAMPDLSRGTTVGRFSMPARGGWDFGKLFYGADVALNAVSAPEGLGFGLSLQGDSRSALVGHWRAGASAL